ncbi:hypothetical protein [Paenibacillus oryzae]|nr:hypothetical protein [Paenibacillus oryzae]
MVGMTATSLAAGGLQQVAVVSSLLNAFILQNGQNSSWEEFSFARFF